MIGEAGPDGAGVLPRCPLYVVVEKILGTTEQLPPDWDTHGTARSLTRSSCRRRTRSI